MGGAALAKLRLRSLALNLKSFPRMTFGSLLALGVVLGACGTHSSAPPSQSVLTVGVQTEDLAGLVQSLRVSMTVNGNSVLEQTQVATPVMPLEINAPIADPTPEILVRVDGFSGPDPSLAGPPIVTRAARAHVVSGKHMLLRLTLEQRCSRQLGGGLIGPLCTTPQTCISGTCADDTVADTSLEPYAVNWPTQLPDLCRPLNAGPAEVVVGSGQSDFLPIVNGQKLQAEKGPQGGHHVYVAIRMKNLKQSGSITTISAVQPGTNVSIPPTAFVFTFDKDEGGYCKLFGLRYQLDNAGIDYMQFLGKPLDISVTVKDRDGGTATGIAHVNIDPMVLGGF